MTIKVSSDLRRGPSVPGPGDLVGGKYRIVRELGRGGMGIVFEAINTLTEHRFALKWLTVGDDTAGLRRFRREARLAGRIQHPHVVDVYDIHVDDDGCFLVMQLLDGESLAKRLTRLGPLSLAEAHSIMLPCLAGLAAAHAKGIIHRDIKPDNIFLCCTDVPHVVHPKILDFGISRVVRGLGEPHTTETGAGVVLGTPAYMAPEQLLSKPCDARVDVYALGVTLYEMVSGEHPFPATTYPELVKKILDGEASPLAGLLPKIAPEFATVISRAMHRSAEERFQNVEALRDALLALPVQDSRSELRLRTGAQPIQRAPTLVQEPRSRSWSAAKVALVAGLGLGAAGLWLASGIQTPAVPVAKPRDSLTQQTQVSPALAVPPPPPAAAANPAPPQPRPAVIESHTETRNPTPQAKSPSKPSKLKSTSLARPSANKRKPQEPAAVEPAKGVPNLPEESDHSAPKDSKPKVVIDSL